MHPLKRTSPLRRIVLASAATVSGMVLLLSLKPHSPPGITVAAPVPAGTGEASSGPGASSDSGVPTSPGSGSTETGTKTVTGDAVDTIWGPVQVRITVQDGKITEADAVTYPKADPLEEQLNEYAVQQLNQETLTAQSADIDVVSGATYTSQGYQQSLQSALDAAMR
ncbi:FMN-binding protein [Streptomyces aurantiogriseus]|uniref:FMN-binding protein n=1 Tax=Streptomyces aurantiogriseus TaxID=66870 RepID=A0A918BTG4_9ACTN|nr:FMN-binding protein [Streptomyces aurantiogriseus]GGQ90834.1 FMN-binding protein [Streptomyces aurantiogriseus]